MFDSKRAIATSIYLVTMCLTLVAALKFHSVLLCMLMIAVQCAALVWYVASYIPYAQDMLRKMLGMPAATAEY